MAEASRSTVVALICNAVTFSFQRCAQMYFTVAPRPAIKSFTPHAKPRAVWSKDRGIFINQPVKNFDWPLDFDSAWHINESAGPDLGPMERGKLCRTECSG